MNKESQSTIELTEKVAELEKQIAELKISKIALDAQNEMLENLLKMAETPEIEEMLKVTLKQALDICSNLTGSEYSSVVLFNDKGPIKEKLFQHHDLNSLEQQNLIKSLLDTDYINWVIAQQKVVLFSDIQNDSRWQWQEHQSQVARSVLSIPIHKNEQVIGLLTLSHSQPGYFKEESANLMQATAKQMALAIDYAHFYGKLETYSHALKLELEKGREMQQDFLPSSLLELPGWKFAAFFKPARRVAGDFYDLFQLRNGTVGLVVGDVCDKGVGAALFMGLFRSLLRIFSGQHSFEQFEVGIKQSLSTNPQDIDALKAVSLTNDYILKNHSSLCMFATLFFGVLNPETGVLTYINGGHEAPIILRATGERDRLRPTGGPVGSTYGKEYIVQQTQLEPGDILIGYSDGVTDARSPQRAFFTEKRLLKILEEVTSINTSLTVDVLVDHIKSELNSHVSDADPFDDITILAVQQVTEVELIVDS